LRLFICDQWKAQSNRDDFVSVFLCLERLVDSFKGFTVDEVIREGF